MEFFLFYFFSSFISISAIKVITVTNPVYAVFFLILCFCNSVGLLFLLEIEFISLLFLIVYVGAIAVLFLFVVIMLNIQTHSQKYISFNFFIIILFSFFICCFFFFEIFLVIIQDLNFIVNKFNYNYTQWFGFYDSFKELYMFGQLLYSYYFYFFLFAGIILLVAIIGVIILTMEWQSVVFYKKQKIHTQLSRKVFNSVFLFK